MLPAKRALAGDSAALLDMAGSFEESAAQIEKSIALLEESAALMENKNDVVELRRRRLRMAERHVAQGARCIGRQRALVATLERDGHDAQDAELLLRKFEEMHALQVAHLDRLQSRLESLGPVPAPNDDSHQINGRTD